jgi:BON domain
LENKTMAWFNRLFGGDKKEAEAVAAAPADATSDVPAEVPAERVGPDGGYDQSGLAKRVAMAFDQDSAVADIETVWVAQTGSKVVLKGKVPTSDQLNRLVEIANNVNGASAVDTEQVEIG